jgi:hypothetical protein
LLKVRPQKSVRDMAGNTYAGSCVAPVAGGNLLEIAGARFLLLVASEREPALDDENHEGLLEGR